MIPLPLSAYIAIGAAVAVMFGVVQTHRLHAAQDRYTSFVAEVKAKGAEQERQTKLAVARSEQITKETSKAYESRLADIKSRYDRMRNANSYSVSVPAIPEATRSPDAAANDQRLLALLRLATEQAEQLKQLQEWVRLNVS